MDYTENYSCEDINQILLDNSIESEGNKLNYSSGKQSIGTDDRADEREKKHDKIYKDHMRIRLKIQFYNFIISFANSIKRIVYQ